MNVYETCPVFENERFLFRLVSAEDCADLLKVYSDPQSVPLFNSDNCHGDDFHYQTMERMQKAIDFWIFSYNNKYFVRWSIIDKQCRQAIGTIELFRREAEDDFTHTALLRLDLRSDYETKDELECIFSALLQPACEWFDCRTITTKAAPEAVVRQEVLAGIGFIESKQPLKGDDGTCYDHYFVYGTHA